MRDAGCPDGAELFELEALADSVEEARAPAEKERDEVQLQLVDESGHQELIDDVGATADEDVLVAGGRSRSWWVTTKTGLWKGGSSPHQPCHGSSPQGPRAAGPNLPRPMISAPTLSSASANTSLLTFSSPPSMPAPSRHDFSATNQS